MSPASFPQPNLLHLIHYNIFQVLHLKYVFNYLFLSSLITISWSADYLSQEWWPCAHTCPFSFVSIALRGIHCAAVSTASETINCIMAPPCTNFCIQMNPIWVLTSLISKIVLGNHSNSLNLCIFILKWKIMLFKMDITQRIKWENVKSVQHNSQHKVNPSMKFSMLLSRIKVFLV